MSPSRLALVLAVADSGTPATLPDRLAFIVKAPVMARLGAVLFMLSDTLIAAGRFASVDVPPGSVWITYAGAQIMIAWGMSHIAPYRDRKKRQDAQVS